MPQLSVRVHAELVRQGLQDLTAEVPRIGRRKIYEMMNRITRKLEGYPPERPGQKYQRTGRYGFSWKVINLQNGYTLENRASAHGVEYAGYVAGDAYGLGQAWMHKGRWDKLRDVVDAEVEQLPEEIENEIYMVARRAGLEVV